MNNLIFSFVFTIVLSVLISPFLFEDSHAKESLTIPPRYQWKQLADPDILTCKEGLILLQKTIGVPACVSPPSYLKLVDRGYGKFDSVQLMKRPGMMTYLLSEMIVEPQLMFYWHTMMLNNPKIMQQTMSNMIFQLKENQEYMVNLIGPMTINSELREQMIKQMKNHNQMMVSFQEHSGWMDYVHRSMLDSNMELEIGAGMNATTECSWCQEIKQYDLQTHQGFHRPNVMEDIMSQIWFNDKMRFSMNNSMLENPYHMSLMTGQMMKPLLGLMMNDPELRQLTIDTMLENQKFMNSIRHENNFSN